MNYFKYTKKIRFYLSLTVFLNLNFLLSPETYTIGGKKGWSDISSKNGVTSCKGRYGYEGIQLAQNSLKNIEKTDLLLDFEDSNFSDKTGKYKIVANNLYLSSNARQGKGAALSRNKGGIEVSGDETSLFGREGPAGSFIIEFWLCPYSVENGERLFYWRSSRNIGGRIEYQLMNFTFNQGKIVCLFSNIFEDYMKNYGDITLETRNSIIPGKWTHHSLSFNEEDGLLEYRLNGLLEDSVFVTTSGREGESVYHAVIGKASNIEICPEYTGLLDDFRIIRSFEGISNIIDYNELYEMQTSLYSISGGRIESVPILLKPSSIINFINADVRLPEATDVKFYIRTGDNHFNWNETYPEWIEIKNNEDLSDIKGMYIQIAADILPDGNRTKTPIISEISIDYTLPPVPQPPFKISAAKGDGSVTLSWNNSVENTTGGYYIYYGTKSGEYLGRSAIEGNSPINAGNVNTYTLTGLKNGTIYYFAVAAWSQVDKRICGNLSKEVYARPSAK